jgi:hypothetical protein
MDEEVDLRVPYIESYIPVGRRKPRHIPALHDRGAERSTDAAPARPAHPRSDRRGPRSTDRPLCGTGLRGSTMGYELVKAHIPYRQFYVPPPKRKVRNEWFGETVDLRIERVDPADAPVAYEVRHRDMSWREHGYQVRVHEDLLWWPLDGGYFGLTPARFATLLEQGYPRSLAMLDESLGRCARDLPDRVCPLRVFPEEFRRVEDDRNNLHNQKARANRGASKMLFCGNGVFVPAGEPLFYATTWSAAEEDRRLSVVVGPSDLDRESKYAVHTAPGPHFRDMCLRRGFAFGIEEIGEGARAVQARGFTVMQVDDIDVLSGRHRAETAPLLCGREIALHLFAVPQADWRHERLRAEIPAIGSATSETQIEVRWHDVLRQLCSSNDPIVAFGFRREIRAAKAVLGRLGISVDEALAPEDDDALAALGRG